jgi:hypothetical protein
MTHYDKWALKLPTFVDCGCGSRKILREIDRKNGYATYECKACGNWTSRTRGESDEMQ